MGELVGLKEEEAFGTYYPSDYDDAKDIVQKTVSFLMHENRLCFDYWKTGQQNKDPAMTL